MIFENRVPPSGNRGVWGNRFGRRKGREEIDDDGFLRRVEIAIPNESEGDVAGEKRSAVGMEEERWVSGGGGEEEVKGKRE